MIAAQILKQAESIFGKSFKSVPPEKKKRKKNFLLKKWNKIQL